MAANRHQRGVSLIEALVAVAVLAFGVLGVAGVQMTLRQNGDVSRQRAEAVRIAQQNIEDWRAFTTLASAGGVHAYADVQSALASAVEGINATYQVTRTVPTPDADGPRMKTVVVDVAWNDRSGQTQSVRLSTSIAGVLPELAGSMGLPPSASMTQLPGGRHPTIPVQAVDQGNGTSSFAPPGSTTSWIFNNSTGLITSICSSPGVCTPTTAFALSGYVRFSTGAIQPTPTDAEQPLSSTFSVGVQVNMTLPTTANVPCYTQLYPGFVSYFCALPVTMATPRWSGQSVLTGLSVAPTLATPALDAYKVCRYTPVQGDVPPNGNIDHPLTYTNADLPLANQNFLVIRAGDGTTPFACPGDDVLTPLLNGNTWRHQPLS